jgi:Cu(I)/Ag(I) efflux system protein CusF
MKPISIFAVTLFISLTAPFSMAQPGADASPATKVTPATSLMSEGEVKKIDKANGKITIKHGPLANLGMPGMTMVFRVKNPAMLEQVKSGDKIRFNAEKMNGALTVVAIETDTPRQ